MTLRTYRFILLADIGMLFLMVGIGFFGDPFLSPDLRALEEAWMDEEPSSLLLLLGGVAILDVLIWLVAYVFLWKGLALGKWLYLACLVLALPMLAFAPPTISSGPVMALDILAGCISAAVLFFPFFEPLRSEFE